MKNEPDEKMIARIHALCADSGEGCLLWKGHSNVNGIPMLSVRDAAGKRSAVSARRVLWEARTGRKLRPTQLVQVKSSCPHENCMTCLELTDRSGLQYRANRNPSVRATRAAAAARTRDIRPKKLDWDKVRRIRTGGEPSTKLAEEFGVSLTLINNVRRNQTWKDNGNAMSAMASMLRGRA
jgi:hypothetical protein